MLSRIDLFTTLSILWILLRRGYTDIVSSSGHTYSRQEVLNYVLNESTYDAKIAPNFEYDNATRVKIQVYVLSIHSVTELAMEYSMDIFLRQKWYDHRLQYHGLTDIDRLEMDQKLIGKVWVPDTIFTNEKQADFHDVTVPNKLMHLYKNGTVFYSSRISLRLSCPMDLERYPLDSQFCPLYLESYGYSTNNLVFHWHEENPVQLEHLELPQFYVDRDPDVSRCDKDYGEAGRFTCLKAGFHFRRSTGYYMIQIFIPSMLIVMLSWVSFWIDIDATPARISLGVLTVLTMTTQSAGARAQLPRVSYVKAIDVWMATCLFFVFAALVEFAHANVLLRRRQPPPEQLDTELKELNGSNGNKPKIRLVPPREIRAKARWVDKISRIIFPIAFAIFNIVFWIYYLVIFIEDHD